MHIIITVLATWLLASVVFGLFVGQMLAINEQSCRPSTSNEAEGQRAA
jgi:hypothetical protein